MLPFFTPRNTWSAQNFDLKFDPLDRHSKNSFHFPSTRSMTNDLWILRGDDIIGFIFEANYCLPPTNVWRLMACVFCMRLQVKTVFFHSRYEAFLLVESQQKQFEFRDGRRDFLFHSTIIFHSWECLNKTQKRKGWVDMPPRKQHPRERRFFCE